MDDDGTFSVDKLDLTEVEIVVKREDREVWRWQVRYLGVAQVEGVTPDGEDAAWRRALAHRDLWIKQELNRMPKSGEYVE